jgi:hypothetical protein
MAANILYGNTVANGQGPDAILNMIFLGDPNIAQNNQNLIGISNGIANPSPTTVFNTNPQLGVFLSANDQPRSYSLAASSPVIDAYEPSTPRTDDQRLGIRPIDGNGNGVALADFGSVEYDPTILSATFTSVASQDGRITESSETSNTGGTIDSGGSSSSALRIGDDSSDRQYKTILSFNTASLPNSATIISATIRMRRGTSSGTNPFTTHGNCYVDIRGGSGFNSSTTLEANDFQATADATQVAVMSSVSNTGDISSGSVNATGRGFINRSGTTQFRIYFQLDDTDDGGNDYAGFYSGNDGTAGNRPTLEVLYR